MQIHRIKKQYSDRGVNYSKKSRTLFKKIKKSQKQSKNHKKNQKITRQIKESQSQKKSKKSRTHFLK